MGIKVRVPFQAHPTPAAGSNLSSPENVAATTLRPDAAPTLSSLQASQRPRAPCPMGGSAGRGCLVAKRPET